MITDDVRLLDDPPAPASSFDLAGLALTPGTSTTLELLRYYLGSLADPGPSSCGQAEATIGRALCHPLLVPPAAQVLVPHLIRFAASKHTKRPEVALRLLAELAAADAISVHVNSPLHADIVATHTGMTALISAHGGAWAARLRDKNPKARAAAAWLLAVLPDHDADTWSRLQALVDAPATTKAFRAQLLLSLATIARRRGDEPPAQLAHAFADGSRFERTAAAVALTAAGRTDEHLWGHLRQTASQRDEPDARADNDVPWGEASLTVRAMAAHQVRQNLARGPAAVAALIRGPSPKYIGAVVRSIGLYYFAARGRVLPAGPRPPLFADELAVLEHLVPAVVMRAPVNVYFARDLLPDETDQLRDLLASVARA